MNETKYCIKCGKSIPADAEFCPYCGTIQPALNAENSNDGAVKQSESDHNQSRKQRIIKVQKLPQLQGLRQMSQCL